MLQIRVVLMNLLLFQAIALTLYILTRGPLKQLNSIENSLGFGISHQVKEKIIKGEYIEMSSLLEKNQHENGEQTVSVIIGELVIKKNQETKDQQC